MNLCEALESGRRYNRAIRDNDHFPLNAYIYAMREGKFKYHPAEGEDEDVEFSEADLSPNACWCLTTKAPYYGPAGVITLERARGMAAQAWCTSENENKVMDSELCEAFAQIMMQIGNGTVAFIEPEKPETNKELMA